MEKETEEFYHPSFGQIRFSRVTCRPAIDFYGSDLPQDHYIQLSVIPSKISRSLTKDWYFSNGIPILELRLSSGQFAELITSMNQGEGIPCTLERIKGEKIPELPLQESRKEFIHRKFENRMKSFAVEIKQQKDEAATLIAKKTLTKDDQNRLNWLLTKITQEVSSNIPFFAKCFQETMDEVVFEAKLEVENAIQHKISVLGLEELHKQQNLLENETNRQRLQPLPAYPSQHFR